MVALVVVVAAVTTTRIHKYSETRSLLHHRLKPLLCLLVDMIHVSTEVTPLINRVVQRLKGMPHFDEYVIEAAPQSYSGKQRDPITLCVDAEIMLQKKAKKSWLKGFQAG